MPELPEVEVLVRHLAPLLAGKAVRNVQVRRPKIVAPTSVRRFRQSVIGARFRAVTRRGKYLLFELAVHRRSFVLIGHLGMTGRMYLLAANAPLPKHAAVVLDLGRHQFVFEDTRYFGRLTLDTKAIAHLGPEPLSGQFTLEDFARRLKHSSQAIKVKLLDQSLVAGVGNIYASEALFSARISPKIAARRLNSKEVERLWHAIREVLTDAIACGSTVPLNLDGQGTRDGLFYFGLAAGSPDFYEERLQVYDRAGKPCPRCGTGIRRIVQAARSTFFCPKCQKRWGSG